MTTQFREPSASEVRARIDAIPTVIEVPIRGHTMKIDGELIQTLDKFLFLSGCRVSEAVTKQIPSESEVNNFGTELGYSVADYHGEEVMVWSIRTLKRRDQIIRSVALPLNQEYEPWTRDILQAWEKGNPWGITRRDACRANSVAFAGLEYSIKPRVVYRLDPATGKTQKNENGKNIVDRVIPDHAKPITDHGLRHIRIKNLILQYGFTPLEVQRWVGWTAGGLASQGINPQMDSYFSLGWQDYISKLLVKRRG